MKTTQAALAEWRSKWDTGILPFLTFVKTHAGIHISDGRQRPDNPLAAFYRAPADAIYLYCSDQPRGVHNIAQYLRDCVGVNLEVDSLQAILDRFVSRGFMLAEDNVYLSLGLPAYRRA